MKNYVLKCQYCGQEFNSSRKDARYCSDSCRVMASQQRKKEPKEENTEKTTVSVEYSDKEYAQLRDTAKAAGITVEETVKFRSLVSVNYLEDKDKEIQTLKKEITKLRAHLSIYTKKPAEGIFLPVSKGEKAEIIFQVEELNLLADEEDATLEDKISWLASNCALYIRSEQLPWNQNI